MRGLRILAAPARPVARPGRVELDLPVFGGSAGGDHVQAAARHDAIQPGADGALSAESLQAAPRADEGVLGGVLGVDF